MPNPQKKKMNKRTADLGLSLHTSDTKTGLEPIEIIPTAGLAPSLIQYAKKGE